jgi:hypothetical protein
MYEAGFGTPSNSPVPVRREDFMPDTRTIGNGVVVNQQGWEAVLEANKNAFALAFVQRPAFSASFPASLTAQQFVDQLDTNVGNVLSSSEKSNLVAVLGGSPADPTNRANVLRQVAENSNLTQRDFNKAFVLMQYFGYLKRNPNDAPDTNFDGYNFWLGKLNQFNGNYIQAEMVKAFIASSEYLNRF